MLRCVKYAHNDIKGIGDEQYRHKGFEHPLKNIIIHFVQVFGHPNSERT
jgi:hypothetical protein